MAVLGSTYIHGDLNILGDSGNAAKKTINNYFPHTNFGGSLEIASDGSSWSEGIRIHAASNLWCGIVLCDSTNTGSTGTGAKTWSMHNNEGTFGIYKNGSNASASQYFRNENDAWAIKGSLTIDGYLRFGNTSYYGSAITYNSSYTLSFPSQSGTIALTKDNGFEKTNYTGSRVAISNLGLPDGRYLICPSMYASCVLDENGTNRVYGGYPFVIEQSGSKVYYQPYNTARGSMSKSSAYLTSCYVYKMSI